MHIEKSFLRIVLSHQFTNHTPHNYINDHIQHCIPPTTTAIDIMIPSPRALRFIPALPWNHLCVACARKLSAARSISSSGTLRKSPVTEEQDERYQIRLAAAKARVPNYAGWWTSILNEHRPPQTMPDPSLLLDADHVFQGAPAKVVDQGKGANTLPRAPSENTLPTALSRAAAASTVESSFSRASQKGIDYHGFEIPVKPAPPGAEDCCMR